LCIAFTAMDLGEAKKSLSLSKASSVLHSSFHGDPRKVATYSSVEKNRVREEFPLILATTVL
ncbi:MAG: hypothetical protein P8173_09435, partial [Gammaproteobacteria bacterium]